jgi:hypothetical protein
MAIRADAARQGNSSIFINGVAFANSCQHIEQVRTTLDLPLITGKGLCTTT